MSDKEIRDSMTSEQILLERRLTCEAINGAIAFGYQGNNPPPSDDHWLAPFWKIGRDLAPTQGADARPVPYAYVYEWDYSPGVVHRSFECAPYNGRQPDRTVEVFRAAIAPRGRT